MKGRPVPARQELVTLYRLPGERLGLGLRFEGGERVTENVQGLLVQSIVDGGPAARARCSWGHLQPGDHIQAIQGVSVTSLTRLNCVNRLADSSIAISLLVRHPDAKENGKDDPGPNGSNLHLPPQPDFYVDLVSEEEELINARRLLPSGHHDSESDDTASSVSTVIEVGGLRSGSGSPLTLDDALGTFERLERDLAHSNHPPPVPSRELRRRSSEPRKSLAGESGTGRSRPDARPPPPPRRRSDLTSPASRGEAKGVVDRGEAKGDEDRGENEESGSRRNRDPAPGDADGMEIPRRTTFALTRTYTSGTGTGSRLFDEGEAERNERRRSSVQAMIEERRKSVSKLRGLIIPTSSSPSSSPSTHLPPIRSTNLLTRRNTSTTTVTVNRSSSSSSSSPPRRRVSEGGTYLTSLQSSPVPSNLPKYSPAFKRKSLSLLNASSPSHPSPASIRSPPPPSPNTNNNNDNNNNNNNNISVDGDRDSDGDSAVSSIGSEASNASSASVESPGNERRSTRAKEDRETEKGKGKGAVLVAMTTKSSGGPRVSAVIKKYHSELVLNRTATTTAAASPPSLHHAASNSSPFAKTNPDREREVSTEKWSELARKYGSVGDVRETSTTSSSSSSSSSSPSFTLNTQVQVRALAQKWEQLSSGEPHHHGIQHGTTSSSFITARLQHYQAEFSKTHTSSSSSSTCTTLTDPEDSVDASPFRLARDGESVENIHIHTGFAPFHMRMSSYDSSASEDSSLPTPVPLSNSGSGIGLSRDHFGSVTSLASSTSLISPQELQQLIEEANLSLGSSEGGYGGGGSPGFGGGGSTPSQEILVVVLHRDLPNPGGSVGITLAGGSDYDNKDITVHKVIGGSIADRDGRIQKGDRLLSINGRSTKGLSHREALAILKTPRSEVVLVLSRSRSATPADRGSESPQNYCRSPPNVAGSTVNPLRLQQRPPRILESPCDAKSLISDLSVWEASRGPPVTVMLKKEGPGLGFSLEGGKDSPYGDRPLTIKKIFSGGVADKEGSMKVGDEILSVNGNPLVHMSRIEAWNFLKRLTDGDVSLVVRKKLEARDQLSMQASSQQA